MQCPQGTKFNIFKNKCVQPFSSESKSSSSSQSNVTINGTASGAIEIIATISNPCQQTNVIRKNIWMGPPFISDIEVLDMNSFPSTTPYIAPSSSSDCSTIGLQLNLTQSLNQISEINI